MDYAKFRLTGADIGNYARDEKVWGEFYRYAITIYKYFAELPSGSSFDITKKVDEKNREKFIKAIGFFQMDFPGQLQINDTYTEILKL